MMKIMLVILSLLLLKPIFRTRGGGGSGNRFLSFCDYEVGDCRKSDERVTKAVLVFVVIVSMQLVYVGDAGVGALNDI